jgi:hypothetical protein
MLIDDYLKQQALLFRDYQIRKPIKFKKDCNNIAVIIEPRNHELLEAVCRNVMYFLPDDWNLVICAYDKEYVFNSLKEVEFMFIQLIHNNLKAEQYNKLFTSVEFWNALPGENILIFQTDSYLCRKITNEYFNIIKEYSFIGGVYQYHKVDDERIDEFLKRQKINIELKKNIIVGDTSNIYKKELELCNSINCEYSINGGFSFRKKSAMIECIQKININKIIEERINKNLNVDYFNKTNIIGEDVFFQNALDILGYKLPSKQVCLEFCTNLPYNNHYTLTSYGVHGFNKYFNDTGKVFIIRPSIEQLYREIKNIL